MGRVFSIVQGLLLLLLICSSTWADSLADAVTAALQDQESWLATSSEEGPIWNEYLLTNELRDLLQSIDGGADVDASSLVRVLARYESGADGLDHSVFAATRHHLIALADSVNISQESRWAARVRFAAKYTSPIEEASVQQARSELADATRALDTMLAGTDAERRDGWKAFLKWDDLDSALTAETPDWKKLQSVGGQFFNGHPGLEYPAFVRVRESLRRYLYLGSLVSNDEAQKSLQLQLENFADTLEKFGQEPTSKQAGEVASLLDWLDQLGQVPSLKAEIRNANMRPNIKLRISENLLSRRFSRDVVEPTFVNEMILETHVRGSGTTTGQITTDVVRNSESARIDIIFHGVTETDSIGVQKPVKIFSRSRTILEARKPLFVFPNRIATAATKATANTNTNIRSIRSDINVGKKLIERFAWRRAADQKPKSSRIAAYRAARRLEKKVEGETTELLTRAQDSLRKQLQGPIGRRGLLPDSMQTHSLDSSVVLLATQANESQFGAMSEPPAFCPHDDVVAQVHESAINNTAEKAIAGLTLTDERIAELTEELTGSVPEGLQIREDDEPWSISFDWRQPVTVEFVDQTMKIAVRGRKFTSGDRTLNKVMEMSATYAMQVTSTGVQLQRQGEIEVRFPGDESERLRAMDRVFKTLMQKKFSEVFKTEIQGKGFSLPGQFESLGVIRLKDLSAEGGWLSLGWN